VSYQEPQTIEDEDFKHVAATHEANQKTVLDCVKRAYTDLTGMDDYEKDETFKFFLLNTYDAALRVFYHVKGQQS